MDLVLFSFFLAFATHLSNQLIGRECNSYCCCCCCNSIIAVAPEKAFFHFAQIPDRTFFVYLTRIFLSCFRIPVAATYRFSSFPMSFLAAIFEIKNPAKDRRHIDRLLPCVVFFLNSVVNYSRESGLRFLHQTAAPSSLFEL